MKPTERTGIKHPRCNGWEKQLTTLYVDHENNRLSPLHARIVAWTLKSDQEQQARRETVAKIDKIKDEMLCQRRWIESPGQDGRGNQSIACLTK